MSKKFFGYYKPFSKFFLCPQEFITVRSRFLSHLNVLLSDYIYLKHFGVFLIKINWDLVATFSSWEEIFYFYTYYLGDWLRDYVLIRPIFSLYQKKLIT